MPTSPIPAAVRRLDEVLGEMDSVSGVAFVVGARGAWEVSRAWSGSSPSYHDPGIEFEEFIIVAIGAGLIW